MLRLSRVQLGFRPEVSPRLVPHLPCWDSSPRQVIDFQPYYVFHKSHWNDLLIGHAVLKEFEEREAEREQRLAKARAEEKAVIEAQKEKVWSPPDYLCSNLG